MEFIRRYSSQRSAIIKELARLYTNSQVKISKAYRKHRLRKLREFDQYSVRLYWDPTLNNHISKDQRIIKRVYLSGDYPNNNWKERHELKWDCRKKIYFIDLIINRSSQFKFIIDEIYVTSSYYPIVNNNGNQNNIFFNLPKPKIEICSEKRISLLNISLVSTDHLVNERKHDNNIEDSPIQDQTDESYQQGCKQEIPLFNSNADFGQLFSIYNQIQMLNYDNESYTQRPQTQEEEQLVFVGDGYLIPKYKESSSEDAFFVTSQGVGVCDGVGGWKNYGIDSSLFSNTLMGECENYIQRMVQRQRYQKAELRVTPQDKECYRQAIHSQRHAFNYNLSSDSDNSSSISRSSSLLKQNQSRKSSLFDMSSKQLCPINILKFSLRRTQHIGSGTATICVLNQKELTCLNLGDSGFILIRFESISNDPFILIRSKEQSHTFNSPYQVAKLPNKDYLRELKIQNKNQQYQQLSTAMKKGVFYQDSPEDSDIYYMRVREGDLLLMATDGVFDNLFQDEIMNIVRKNTKNQIKTKESARQLSKLIAEAAYIKSQKKKVKTPFSVKKAQYHQHNSNYKNNKQKVDLYNKENDELNISIDSQYENMCFQKGKIDDITVTSLWIQNQQ